MSKNHVQDAPALTSLANCGRETDFRTGIPPARIPKKPWFPTGKWSASSLRLGKRTTGPHMLLAWKRELIGREEPTFSFFGDEWPAAGFRHTHTYTRSRPLKSLGALRPLSQCNCSPDAPSGPRPGHSRPGGYGHRWARVWWYVQTESTSYFFVSRLGVFLRALTDVTGTSRPMVPKIFNNLKISRVNCTG